jgi:hypothetical protein
MNNTANSFAHVWFPPFTPGNKRKEDSGAEKDKYYAGISTFYVHAK